jgi:hypothetical protein
VSIELADLTFAIARLQEIAREQAARISELEKQNKDRYRDEVWMLSHQLQLTKTRGLNNGTDQSLRAK